MSKSHRKYDADKKIHRVGKTVKRSLDKYPRMIYNIASNEENSADVNEQLLEELHYEEKLNKIHR